MKLSKIKIAGFKSFVDPSTITLPSNLIAVVGPNGCGKSNIIDAIKWVMGESSSKNLRGESLTDVIFNGSSARKPVGQASVELVFDNADASIGGEYANYAEISVKRIINRESDSNYFLNGARCRRRDITDIFAGTGLGPRSYSIIGQNMISQMVEAKPDDLRVYLEEAAGISKYKQRRHETELRINHTKENLSRVNDLAGELDKQLNHLQHQANVAEKFKTLKAQERTLRAELYSIQWRSLDIHMVECTLQIQREETALEARQSELISTDREIEMIRHEQRVAQDATQEVQRRYYAVGNEITRIEQDVLHHQERQTQLESDLKNAENDYQTFKNQMAESEDELNELEHEIINVEPTLAEATKEAALIEDELVAAEEEMQDWQAKWDEFNRTAAAVTQTEQVEKTRIQHIDQRVISLKKRQDQLQQEQGRFNFAELTREVEEYSHKSYEAAEKLEVQKQELDDTRNELQTLQGAQHDSSNHLDKVRNDLQRLRGQQASLEALQQTALGRKDNKVTPWIAKHQLGEKPRLAQNIEVEKGWEMAVEKVLGFCLQAICVDKLQEVTPHINELTSGNLCVFTADKANTNNTYTKGESLLTKIKSPWPLNSLVAGIYVADNMDAALALCEKLNADESVVTKDGVWMNKSWLKIVREEDPAAGVFQREQELKELAAKIEALEARQADLEEGIADRKEKIKQLEQQREQIQIAYNQLQSQSAQFNAQRRTKEERLTELKSQVERCLIEFEECTQQLQAAEGELKQAHTSFEQASQQLAQQTQTHDGLVSERDRIRQHLVMLRESTTHKRDYVHELEIRSQTAKSQKSALQQNIMRVNQQIATLNERKIALQGEVSSLPPADTLKKSLSRALDKHVSIESELNTARVALESLEQEFANLENKRHVIERDINKVRGSLEKFRVELEGWRVKSDNILEQMKDTEYKLEDILKDLPQEVSSEEWQAKLDQTVNRINRLGAINLMAIEEYATCLERKQYIDKQLEDLNAGLSTLEEAIAKIDKETKHRFKETFDKVNERFQELFPTIFGGGKAYLELTSEDLLEAGITMMACPPGKRNSSIYLLSGGEKSLTALALIFSIFHLNPAPFCLLDEVDAALDDANVLRFTRLVKAMADKTQFIFISHNKISIEMGEHLIGVTMNEPGVSRLVTVDIEKAITLAGS